MTPTARHVGLIVTVRRSGLAGKIEEWSQTAGGHTRARVRFPGGELLWFHARELDGEILGPLTEESPHD